MTEDGTKARGAIAVCIAILLLVALVGSFMLNPSERQQSNLNLIIGALIGALSTVVGFYFGSSSGAKMLVAGQQKILEAAVPAVAAAAPLGASPGPTGNPGDPVSVTEVKQ